MYVLIDRRISEDLGIPVNFALIEGVSIQKSSPGLEDLLENAMMDLRKKWTDHDRASDPRISGFHALHTSVGVTSTNLAPAPESLIEFVLRRGRFPRVNTIVDVYNVVSATSRLSLGLHDYRRIDGALRFGITVGSERFLPLGATEEVKVPEGEYAYMDDLDILCRLEVRQCEKTKVTSMTKDVLLIVQGNAGTPVGLVKKETERAIELIRSFCGGSGRLLDTTIFSSSLLSQCCC